MTVLDLIAKLKSARAMPVIEGFELTVPVPAPATLVPFIELLQSGVRAHLAGKKWYGFNTEGRPAAKHGILKPGELLPADVRLLCCEGDPTWDKVAWHSCRDLSTSRAFVQSDASDKRGAA